MPSPPDPPPGLELARIVQERGVRDSRVLKAMAALDRGHFVPRQQRPHANEDVPLPIGQNQTISQPYMVAAMTEALALSGTERVLEIGTGSGYQAAMLALLAREVYTIERHTELSLRARSLLDRLGLTNVRFRIGDGTLGWLEEAPFDRILVTAGAPEVPPALLQQLADRGRLVAPIGPAESQTLLAVDRQGDQFRSQALFDCRFVPLIGEEGWPEFPEDGPGTD